MNCLESFEGIDPVGIDVNPMIDSLSDEQQNKLIFTNELAINICDKKSAQNV